MPENSAKFINRLDYRPPDWLVDETRLNFKLNPQATRVSAEISFRRNPIAGKNKDLKLDGRDLKLIQLGIDGTTIGDSLIQLTDRTLTIPNEVIPSSEFTLQTETEINPESNTSLEGLYMSQGMYCTQCEPEGFRRICYFPDRPDVLSRFSVSIENNSPVLLSNGNLKKQGDGFAEWQDPWPKPSYLFALVAGDLVSVEDSFTTMSGRKVELRIWVRKGDEKRCDYAMDALKRSMKWDEENYGREYDLEQFNIVAVDDFNMGAMENKGLNIFNSSLVLASPDTAVDQDYAHIESVIAHEYFHNWTGNRITCRDWFQLSLKEGLTVYRDHQFSRDERSAETVRIREAQVIRKFQFLEDAGPRAHPVRPNRYQQINNFYTLTIYEKGAELINMLRQIVGAESYRKALDHYFEIYDGQACTIEDWIKAFEDSLNIDLTQFKLWYSQAGTPEISWEAKFENNQLQLVIEQNTKPTPKQSEKLPLVIPIAVGLIDKSGEEVLPTKILLLTRKKQTFTFDDLKSQPHVSILREFSAPVILKTKQTYDEKLFALRHDSDSFNRWDAGQRLMQASLYSMLLDNTSPNSGLLEALSGVVMNSNLDPAFRALMLQLPPEGELRRHRNPSDKLIDPIEFHTVCEQFKDALAQSMSSAMSYQYQALEDKSPYSPDSKAAGRRNLRIELLRLISRLDGGEEAQKLYDSSNNMTNTIGSLKALLSIKKGSQQIQDFYGKWKHDRLVLDKWFAIQVLEAHPSDSVQKTIELTEHPDFNWMNPNRFRSVIVSFALHNLSGFHVANGAGYALVADWIIKTDAKNALLAARTCTFFENWRDYDRERQSLMLKQMKRIRNTKGLSNETSEVLDTVM